MLLCCGTARVHLSFVYVIVARSIPGKTRHGVNGDGPVTLNTADTITAINEGKVTYFSLNHSLFHMNASTIRV